MKRLALLLGLILSGCIPPPAPQSSADMSVEPPHIEPQFESIDSQQPVWETRPVTANATTISASTYIVQSGDTLRGIGEKTGAGSEAIALTNAIEAPFVVRVGQQLSIPAGKFHKVAAGETGIAIARAYGVDWHQIITLNALSEPFILRLGQRLMLPEGATPSDQALEARAAAFKLDIDDIITGGEPATDVTAPKQPTIAVLEPDHFSGTFLWPANGTLASRFGASGVGRRNDGIDIAVAQLSPIRASGEGVIAFVGNNVANYGGLILIRHGDGWITAYGRASSASVIRGQSVKRGQIIGKAGTGSAPLLFFQMRKDRVPVDPLKELPPR